VKLPSLIGGVARYPRESTSRALQFEGILPMGDQPPTPMQTSKDTPVGTTVQHDQAAEHYRWPTVAVACRGDGKLDGSSGDSRYWCPCFDSTGKYFLGAYTCCAFPNGGVQKCNCSSSQGPCSKFNVP
jgi:hypothetical protein